MASAAARAMLASTILVLAFGTAACAEPRHDPWYEVARTGGHEEPLDAAEHQILAEAGTLPVDVPVEVHGWEVNAGEPYFAASGRECRPLRMQRTQRAIVRRRLVCTEDGSTYFFAPGVVHGAPADARLAAGGVRAPQPEEPAAATEDAGGAPAADRRAEGPIRSVDHEGSR